LNASGLVAVDGYQKSAMVEGVEVKVKEGRTTRGRSGFVAETVIPLSALGVSQGETLAFCAEVTTPAGVKDTFFGVNKSKPDTWQRIYLK
jgi:hypothetical protein